MKTTKIGGVSMPTIDLNDADAAQQLADAIGAKPGDTVQIVTPQFTRPANELPACLYPGDEAFYALHERTPDELRTLGLRPWNEAGDPEDGDRYGGGVLWLLPGEWYSRIPEGAPLLSICGRHEAFARGQTDDDIRFGCLPYGVVVGARQGWRAR